MAKNKFTIRSVVNKQFVVDECLNLLPFDRVDGTLFGHKDKLFNDLYLCFSKRVDDILELRHVQVDCVGLHNIKSIDYAEEVVKGELHGFKTTDTTFSTIKKTIDYMYQYHGLFKKDYNCLIESIQTSKRKVFHKKVYVG